MIDCKNKMLDDYNQNIAETIFYSEGEKTVQIAKKKKDLMLI